MTLDMNVQLGADLASMKSTAAELVAATDITAAPQAGAGDAAGFAQSMTDALHRIDGQERDAASRMEDVDSGRSDDLIGAMLASQQASLSFSMLMQVRNKVMGAVDDLVKLPL